MKSTHAKNFGKLYILPVYHSDEVFGTNWSKIDKKIIQNKSDKKFDVEKWINDGDFAEERQKVLNFAKL